MFVIPSLVLALAISTVTADEASKEHLMGDVSSAIATAVAQTAFAAQTAQASRPALYSQLRSALSDAVARFRPQLLQLAALSNSSGDIAKELANQIVQDNALREMLVTEGEVAPRFIGAFTLGVAEILVDAINTVMRDRKV